MRVTNPSAAESSWSGPTTRYAYSFAADGSGTVDVTDPRGGVWTYTVDAQGRVTKTEAPTTDGKRLTSTQTWSSTSKVNQYTAPGTATSPSSTTFAFDANDNPTGSTTPASAGTLYSGARYGEGATAPGGHYLPTSIYSEQDYAATSGSSVGGMDPSTWIGLEYSAQGNLKVAKRNATITPSVSIAYGSEVKGTPGAGRITSTTDPRGAITSYWYDNAGNVNRIVYPAPGTGTAMGDTHFNYSATTADRALNRLSHATDGKLQKRTFTYDALDRITQIRWVNSAGTVTEDVFFVYDADGNLIERRDSTGTMSYQYDQLGRLAHQDAPAPGFVDPDYDASSNLTSLIDESGTVTYAYKPNNRLASIAEPGGSCTSSPTTLCTTYSYDDSGPGGTTLPVGIARTVTQRLPNGISTTEQLDAAGRLVRTDSTLGSTLVQRFVYQYQHANGREMMLRSQETDYAGNRRKYGYDALDRLRRVDYLNSAATVTDWREYRWDAASNRTLVERKPLCGKFYDRVNYNYNSLNQLVSVGAPGNGADNCAYGTSGTWSYDANGNQIQHCTEGNGGATSTSSPEMTLSTSSTTATTCTAAFTYNLKNQFTTSSRIYAGAGQSEIVSESGAAFTNSFLGILSHGGTTYFTRTDQGRLVSHRKPANTAPNRRHYYLLDALSTIRTVVDENGAVVSRVNHDPFGEPGSGSSGTFGFASGRHTDGLIHFGERYYDPQGARWTQPDPINQFADIRQSNRYAYVGGDPINLTDPSGLRHCGTVRLSPAERRRRGIPPGAAVPRQCPHQQRRSSLDEACAVASVATLVWKPAGIAGVPCAIYGLGRAFEWYPEP